MIEDTISAVATALGEGSVGIIRISGEQALEIGEKLFKAASKKKIERNYGIEPNEVKVKEETITMNVDIPRIASAYKIDKSTLKKLKISPYELDLYIHLLIDISLGMTSDIRNTWLNKKLFINSSYRVIETDSHYVIEFIATSLKPDELKNELDKYLKDIKIDENSFNRQKKIWIAGEVKNINSIQTIGYSVLDDILDYGEFISNKTDIIRNLDYQILKQIKSLINFDIKSSIKIINE